MNFQVGQKLQLTITGITHEGLGVGKVDGFVFFVPFCVVNETVLCTITKINKNFGTASLDQIVTPSESRIQPDCPYYQICGGCVYRHMAYQEELRMKTQTVKDALKKLGNLPQDICHCLPSPCIQHYRNNCQTPVFQTKDNTVISGFYKKKTHTVVDMKSCQIEPILFSEVRQSICSFIAENKISIFDAKTKKGTLKEIYLRCDKSFEKIYITLALNSSKFPNQEKLVRFLTEKYPQIVSIVLNYSNKKHSLHLGEKNTCIFGNLFMEDDLAGISLKIAPQAFYQVNQKSAEKLYSRIKEFAQVKTNETVLDLYCGTGSIGLSLASCAKQVIGVDIVPQAIENAKVNAHANNLNNTKFYCLDAAQAAKKFASENVHPNLIIVDPPRKGCEQLLLQSLIAMDPEKIIMVSCNPATLARDLAYLTEHSYEIKIVQPVDMFPRTHHVETVVLLSK